MNKERFLIGLPFDASDWPWLDASDWSTKKTLKETMLLVGYQSRTVVFSDRQKYSTSGQKLELPVLK